MKINDQLSYKFLEVGKEKTVVIIIDNFLASTASLISLAAEGMYNKPPETSTYPGIRSPIWNDSYLNLVAGIITAILNKNGFIDKNIRFNVDESTFSLLTTREVDLDPNHTIPHFDGPESNRLAVLHYLNNGEFGGTAFYRHIPTQFENITRDKVVSYVNAAEQFSKQISYLSGVTITLGLY